MRLEQAEEMLTAFFGTKEPGGTGLSEETAVNVMVADLILAFEYEGETGTLKCGALIHKFSNPPEGRILDAFQIVEVEAVADTGGGTLDYSPESQTLLLSRSYTEPVPEQQFTQDLGRLLEACRLWRTEVVEQVAETVYQSSPARP